uniref:START domain-containing protein n=1 Tax=Ditylenchus dipsaci TaxID=166011 RepID=A0A915E7E0_9BILA
MGLDAGECGGHCFLADKEVYMVRHLVKKNFPMSARESLDLVKVVRYTGGEVVFGSTGAVHKDYPPTKAYVRTHQHVGGYKLLPDESNPAHTKFYMLFHADLNLPGPRLLSSIAGKFKPKFMLQKIDNLQAAIAKFDI